MDDVYYEIDECLDLMKFLVFLNVVSDFESYIVEFKDLIFFDKRDDILNIQNRKMYLLLILNGICLYIDNLDLYI